MWNIVHRRKRVDWSVPPGGRAMFESLEPRLLLNADVAGTQPLPSEIPSLDPAIQVMPDQPDSQPSNMLSLTAPGPGPSDYEQYLLELINRARSDPASEAARYGIDLNEGLSPGTISSDPKQPLAVNPDLVEGARAHSQWMIDNDVFSHTGANGSAPGDRMAAAGYVFLPPWSWGKTSRGPARRPTRSPRSRPPPICMRTFSSIQVSPAGGIV